MNTREENRVNLEVMKQTALAEVPRLSKPDVILLGFRGSIAHGTYVPSTDPDSIDDRDYIGVFVAPLAHYYGVRPQRECEEISPTDESPHDVVLYELVKFVKLMKECNPNILATLFAPPQHVIEMTDAGAQLWAIKDAFLSKKLFKPFVGYAQSQLKRMTAFGDEKQQFKGKKRKELIQRFGYDTKNAAHLIRILRMGVETLLTGTVQVDRRGIDAEELLAIKRGEWSKEDVRELADALYRQAEDALRTTKLPDEPDHMTIDETTLSILRYAHGVESGWLRD